MTESNKCEKMGNEQNDQFLDLLCLGLEIGDTYYIIDKNNIIVRAGPSKEWFRFACENKMNYEKYDPIRLRGRCLFDFVQGNQTRRLYQKVHDSLWSGRKQRVVLRLRADSPEKQRTMRISVSSIGNNMYILYICQIWDEVPQPYLGLLDLPFYDPERKDHISSNDKGIMTTTTHQLIIPMCSFCQCVYNGEKWLPSCLFYSQFLRSILTTGGRKSDHSVFDSVNHYSGKMGFFFLDEPEHKDTMDDNNMNANLDGVYIHYQVCEKCTEAIEKAVNES
eukprot:TRINITY_DN9541_c0_g1_i1.p1 TRINITY_DN9541_c0_g1~~TRINITY_DN9541_c0_g1_i1.p1  ORF type:complete len:278 (+),score=11.92 TRINITY_DN9541_c0_g1_i1:75-908(+)